MGGLEGAKRRSRSIMRLGLRTMASCRRAAVPVGVRDSQNKPRGSVVAIVHRDGPLKSC